MNKTERDRIKEKKNKRVSELIQNTFIIFVGKISTQFLSFLLLPLYTSYINTSEYGYVDLITTYISLLITIVILQLDMAAFRFLIDCRNNKQKESKVITNIVMTVIFLTTIFTVIYIPIAKFVLKIQYLWIILLIIISNIFSTVLLQIARGLGKNKDYSISSIISGITTIIFNIILIAKYRLGGIGLLISMLISNLVIIIYLILRVNLFNKIKIKLRNKKISMELIKYSAPLVPNQLSLWVINVSDRTIISTILGTAFNGIYSIANKFSIILNSIYNVFYLAWSEQASIHFSDEDKDNYFSLVINNGIKIFGTACLLLISIMPLLFNILINSSYGEAYNQIPILLLGTLFNIVVGMLGTIYIAKKLTKEIAKTSLIAAIINIVVNVLFIKFIGLYAASFSTLIAYFTVVVYRWFDIKKYVKIKIQYKKIFLLVIGMIIAIVLYYLNKLSTNILSILIAFYIAIYINKNIIVSITNKFKNTLKLKKN